jgi:acyl-CoA reductase-like NAD-dependent aldehyde dehydrogenase
MVEAALTYAKTVVRGGPTTAESLAAGAFYRPTLLEVDDVKSVIVQKKVFAPAAIFEIFESEADAIWRANAARDGVGGRSLHERSERKQPRRPWHTGRDGLDQHTGGDQQRVR